MREILAIQGRKQKWVIEQLGLGTTSGYALLRTGKLPADEARRKRVLGKLAEITGLPAGELLFFPYGT